LLNQILQLLLAGVAQGCVYALVALGFVLIYKATETVNFAQGDLMMLGAFFALTASVIMGWPYWATILFAVAVMAVVGMLTERLVLSSVHQAKGLEWRVVFVLRMCEGDFPSEMALREPAGEEEERRIFYVATTRAKDELYITHPLMDMSLRGNGQLFLQPSRFLREIRFTLYEQGVVESSPSWRDEEVA